MGFEASARSALNNAESILIAAETSDLATLQTLLISYNAELAAASEAASKAQQALVDAEALRDGDLAEAIAALNLNAGEVNTQFSAVQGA